MDDALTGIRLADFLERAGAAFRRADLRWTVAAGNVRINGMTGSLRQRLRAGDVVQFDVDGLTPRPASGRGLPGVLFESASVLVIDKPAGVLTVPDRGGRDEGIHGQLPTLRPQADLRIVHRLDRDTSGCLLLGKGIAAARHFDAQFRSAAVQKTYTALVDGVPAGDTFPIDAWLGPDRRRPGKVVASSAPGPGLRDAHTVVEVRRRFMRHALLDLRPRTGRSHQLRVHLASIGHAIVGDRDYGGQDLLLSMLKGDYKLRCGVVERPLLQRMFLHAQRVEFEDVDGTRVDVLAPLPDDLTIALQKLDSYDGRRR